MGQVIDRAMADARHECRRCGAKFGGGPGSVAMHQKSKLCRAAFRSPQVTPPVNPVGEVDGEHRMEVDFDRTPGADLDFAETEPEQPSLSAGHLMERACDRLGTVGREAEQAERRWANVRMVDEHGFPLSESPEDQGASGEVGAATHQDADRDDDDQLVLGHLTELMAPSDGSLGLAAAQRKRLFTFADACLSRGGSRLTISDILRSAAPAKSSSSNSERLLEAYLDSLCSSDGWTEKTFSVVTGHSATTRWNSDIISDLVALVQDPQLFPRMRLKPEYDGQRFDHPATGLHMYSFYELIKKQREGVGDWDPEGDVVLLLVFFSDATLLANKGSLSAHPVVLSIANLPPKLATGNQLLLGFLSEFDKTRKEGGSEDKRDFNVADHGQLRRAMMAKQTAAMVSPLVRASYEGVPFISPVNGRKMRFFPTLFCAPLDHPEICSHLGVKSTYCGICKWKGKGYENDKKIVFRTEADSIEFVEMIRKAPTRNIDSLRLKQGAHGQRSGLWGFNGSAPTHALPAGLTSRTERSVRLHGSTTPWTDIHLAVAGEMMHEIDLGVLIYARKAVLYHLRETQAMKDSAIEALNEAIRLAMTHESRWAGLRYPPSKKTTAVLQGYYGGTSRVEAGEHRSVLQYCVPILVRFLGYNDPATRLMACVIKYYRARQVHPADIQPGLRTHTPQSLRHVDKLFDQMKSMLKDVKPPTKSEETPKMHQQSHFRLQVMRLGTTSITTGQAGEANNAKIKSSVSGKRTNMQKVSVERTIVKLYRRSRATCVIRSGRTSALPASQKRYKTSEILAAQKDFCVFSSQRNVRKKDRLTTVDIHNYVRNHIGSLARPRQMAKYDGTTDVRRDLFHLAPADSFKDQDTVLNKKLGLIFGDWSVAKAFLSELSFFLTGQSLGDTFSGEFNFTLKIVHSASNPSVLAHASRKDTNVRLLQKLRADPAFRDSKKMQYDFVAVVADSPHKGDPLWYARILLLFHIQDPGNKGTWRQLVFLRYLAREEKLDDELRRIRKSDSEPNVTPLVYSHRQRKNKTVWYYGVCSIESIIRKVHVVAGNAEGSNSLRNSRGERSFFEVDRRAKFLLNNNIFDSTKEAYFRPHPPSD